MYTKYTIELLPTCNCTAMRLPAEAGEMWTTRAHKESKQKPRESTEAREQQSTSGAIDITIPTHQEKSNILLRYISSDTNLT